MYVVYSLKTKNYINKGRYELFEKGYQLKNENEEILKRKIVGYDPSIQFRYLNTSLTKGV